MRVVKRWTGRKGSNRYHLHPKPGAYADPRSLCGTVGGMRATPGKTLCPDCSRLYMRGCADGTIEYDPLPFTILGKVAS